MLDQVWRTDQPAYSPPCGIEVLPGRANGKSQGCNFRVESSHACERNVVQAVIDFIGEDQDFMLDAEGSDFLEFGGGEDFADGIMANTIS